MVQNIFFLSSTFHERTALSGSCQVFFLGAKFSYVLKRKHPCAKTSTLRAAELSKTKVEHFELIFNSVS